MVEPPHITLVLQPDGVIAPTLRVLQQTVEVVSFSLSALENADLSQPPKFEGSRFQFLVGGDVPAAVRKESYTNWLLSKGFQDLARGIRLSLEEALLYNSIVELARTDLPNIKTWEALQDRMQQFRKRADEANFPDLLAQVNKGLTAPLHFESQFLSLQKVRNCLEHRDGVVADKDVDPDTKVLRLALPRIKLFIEKEGKEIEIDKGSLVEANTAMGMKNVIQEQEFKLGERITFKAEEFHDIGYGYWLIASDLASKLPKFESKVSNQGASA